jgi:coenzyme F420-reducing hydrogenase delta subunit
LAEVGLEPERLDMFYLSASQGAYFAEVATEMTERARRLGPNPLKASEPEPLGEASLFGE